MRFLNSQRHFSTGLRGLLLAGSALAISACAEQTASDAAEAGAELVAAASNEAWPEAAVAEPTSLGFTTEGLDALNARMAQSVSDQDVKGMVTLLSKDGEVVQFNAYGQQDDETAMSTDTIFRIYSMSKPITGVAMMQLYEQGLWELDDPVTKHVPELANLKVMTGVDSAGDAITVDMERAPTMREIMTHTAGFGYGLGGSDPVNEAFRSTGVLASSDLNDMMDKVDDIPLLFQPGERWSYSVSVDIQGYIVEKMSGQSLGEYMDANIFTPLGMDDTAFYVSEEQEPRFADVYRWDEETNSLIANEARPDRPGFTDPNRMESGGGGLISSTHDYARFCQMMLNKGELAGNRVLKAETIDLMTQNHIGDLRLYSDGTLANPGLPGVGFGMDYAVHIDTEESDAPYGEGTYYWGGAAGTWFWIDPVNDLFFVGMIQSMGGRRPDAMNFRGESADLVYSALATETTSSSDTAH